MPRAQLIVNPISGKGRGLRVMPHLEGLVRRLGYETSTFVTQRRDDARAFAASLDRRTSVMLVVGGDGTLNEVINGQTNIPLTVFPVGTANAFAADQGIRGTVEFLEELLKTGVIKRFDLGEAGGRKFINMASCGILGQIHRAFWEHREGPDSLVRCFARAFNILRRGQFSPVAMWCDETLLTRTAFLTVVGNTRTYAPWVSFTPLASPFDGVFDVCTFPAPSRLDFVRWFVGVLTRRHTSYKEVGYTRARTCRMAGEGVACHVDGEYVGPAPLTLSVLPSSLPILVPASKAAPRTAESTRDGELPRAA